MKSLMLLSLLALATAPAVLAQAPTAANTVKTKVKPAGQPSVKTKTTQVAEAPAVAGPSDAVIDTKANALTVNMQKNLGLNPQQTEKVRVINRRAIDNVETARLRYRTDPRKLAGVVESISSSRLSAIKEVLTSAQFDKYQRKREEKMGVPNVQGVQGNPAPGLGGGADQ
ncbi:hypothetical protein I2I05_04105 [Hymenobacter sp. BT683]|uniref:DUF4168 domain-containing protein n=1 Tax=Hymenobacter jeongseonensis TaxID=2791027 RepID=A0ABS0IE09_9BACT|nr:hypothetical protein [Hymenobacter jeongseonensis]MBF9236572.1 hypothetical protein [Hymenobacter jeongseonensis]